MCWMPKSAVSGFSTQERLESRGGATPRVVVRSGCPSPCIGAAIVTITFVDSDSAGMKHRQLELVTRTVTRILQPVSWRPHSTPKSNGWSVRICPLLSTTKSSWMWEDPRGCHISCNAISIGNERSVCCTSRVHTPSVLPEQSAEFANRFSAK